MALDAIVQLLTKACCPQLLQLLQTRRLLPLASYFTAVCQQAASLWFTSHGNLWCAALLRNTSEPCTFAVATTTGRDRRLQFCESTVAL